MRLLDALLDAMRTRRARRLGLDEADRLVAGDRAGPGTPGLDHLLDAARAPATAEETSGERAMAAALAAERRRAVPATGRKGAEPATGREGSKRVLVPVSARTLVIGIVTGVALLSGGTAVAARTGNLPPAAQQHAHRLFSALGVPAPRTGPAPSASPSPHPTPRSNPPSRTPQPAPTAVVAPETRASWCAAWQEGAGGGKPMGGPARRELVAAAGGEDAVTRFCAPPSLPPSRRPTPSSPAPASVLATTAPTSSPAQHSPTPSHPAPPVSTPSHPGPGDRRGGV
jgi:hypothetical protein